MVPTAQSTSATKPHDRHTTWWWLSPDPRLVARHRARRLDAPYKTRGSQRTQHVVHGLMGHFPEILTHDTDDRLRIGVRMLVYSGQHRPPGTGHTQRSPAQQLLNIQSRGHRPKCGPLSGINQEPTGQPLPTPAAGMPAMGWGAVGSFGSVVWTEAVR